MVIDLIVLGVIILLIVQISLTQHTQKIIISRIIIACACMVYLYLGGVDLINFINYKSGLINYGQFIGSVIGGLVLEGVVITVCLIVSRINIKRFKTQDK